MFIIVAKVNTKIIGSKILVYSSNIFFCYRYKKNNLNSATITNRTNIYTKMFYEIVQFLIIAIY